MVRRWSFLERSAWAAAFTFDDNSSYLCVKLVPPIFRLGPLVSRRFGLDVGVAVFRCIFLLRGELFCFRRIDLA